VRRLDEGVLRFAVGVQWLDEGARRSSVPLSCRLNSPSPSAAASSASDIGSSAGAIAVRKSATGT
jgi:hypothetical protein